MEKHAIKKRILLPLLLVLSLLLLTFIYDIYQSKQRDIALELKNKLTTVPEFFQTEIDHDANMILSIIATLNENSAIREAFRRKDREGLLALTGELFSTLRDKHGITHFYYTGPDRINLLRVHKPDRYGDRIERSTMLQAERSGEAAYGIELGPLGTFTLRVVQPLHDDKGRIGYLELGQEIDHIIPSVRKMSGADIMIAIHKEHLTRNTWEEGMNMLGRNAEWDQMEDKVIIAKTVKPVPENLLKLIAQSTRTDNTSLTIMDDSGQERDFRCTLAPLFDASGTEVGDIVIMLDVTARIAQARKSIIRDTLLFIVISSVLFIVLTKYIGKVESYIFRITDKLFYDIRKRKATEKKLKNSLKEKDVVMKEVHHRVKNNMSVIISLLSLQLSNIKDEKQREIFLNSINRIRAMSLIHEKLYASKNVSEVDFRVYIEKVIENMFSSYSIQRSKISMLIDVKNVTMNLNTAIPCGLIINELITNSLKHAFPEDKRGEISLGMRHVDEEEIELTYSDNGVGLPVHIDIEQCSSIGLSLVNALVRQLSATVNLSLDSGTGYTIRFPVSHLRE